MNAETYIKAQLAELAILEGARHGAVHNMVAVAMVMRNRVNAGWYGGEWMDVISQAADRAGTTYQADEIQERPGTPQINLRNAAVRQLLQRIDDIYDGSEDEDPTDGALFYCELNRVDREWFKANVLRDREEHPLVYTCGPVAFFR